MSQFKAYKNDSKNTITTKTIRPRPLPAFKPNFQSNGLASLRRIYPLLLQCVHGNMLKFSIDYVLDLYAEQFSCYLTTLGILQVVKIYVCYFILYVLFRKIIFISRGKCQQLVKKYLQFISLLIFFVFFLSRSSRQSFSTSVPLSSILAYIH